MGGEYILKLLMFSKKNIDDAVQYFMQEIYRNFSKEQFLAGNGDVHMAVEENGEITAICSLWWSEVPFLENEKAGVIGHFEAKNKSSAEILLNNGCRVLSENACTIAVGPMDGNTWRKYRLITWGTEQKPFFLEPQNSEEYPKYFQDCGFDRFESYFSCIDRNISLTDERLFLVRKRLYESGIKIRRIKPDEFRDELKKIYNISINSFVKNRMYADIDFSSFEKMYEGMNGKLVEELVLIAERGEESVGFVFAYPDFNQALRGEKVDTVIVKTVAVISERKNGGLGNLLVAMVRENAAKAGFTKAIYALMHKSNDSINIAKKNNGEIFREYTLFSRKLKP